MLYYTTVMTIKSSIILVIIVILNLLHLHEVQYTQNIVEHPLMDISSRGHHRQLILTVMVLHPLKLGHLCF